MKTSKHLKLLKASRDSLSLSSFSSSSTSEPLISLICYIMMSSGSLSGSHRALSLRGFFAAGNFFWPAFLFLLAAGPLGVGVFALRAVTIRSIRATDCLKRACMLPTSFQPSASVMIRSQTKGTYLKDLALSRQDTTQQFFFIVGSLRLAHEDDMVQGTSSLLDESNLVILGHASGTESAFEVVKFLPSPERNLYQVSFRFNSGPDRLTGSQSPFCLIQ